MSTIMNEHPEHILKRLYDNLKFEEIISYCDEQIKLDQSNYLFFGARGRSFYELNQLDKAINDISKSLELYPNYIKGLFNRSQCYFDLEKYQLAIYDIEKAHSLSSEEIFYDQLGLSYVYIDDGIKAIENFTLHLKDNLDNQVLAWRANAHFHLDQFKEAIKDYETILSSDIDSSGILNIEKNFYSLLGLSYLSIDDHIKAVENFTLSLKDNLDYDVLAWRAEAYFYLDQFEEARKDYETILLSDVENSQVFNNIEKINSYEFNDNCSREPIFLNSITSFIGLGFSILKEEKSSGIYILEFSNGEYYVGQTKKIQNRLKQHRKIFDDISNVYFKLIIEDELFNEENKAIAFFERNLLRIRNLKQIEFANIFDEDCQKLWVSDLNYNYLSGSKFDNEIVRGKFSDRFNILQEQIYFPKLIIFLSSYLKLSIPNYLASEYNYWHITCLPKYLAKENCISRININAVPALSVYKNANNSLHVMLFVSKLPFLKYLKKHLSFEGVFDNIPSLRLETRNTFEVTEGDEITVFIEEKDFDKALNNELILSAIRLFNLRMMNKTGKEKKHRRTVFHCLDLSDLIINGISR